MQTPVQNSPNVEVYSFTFDSNFTTQSSIGNDSSLSSLMYDLYNNNNKNVGYIMFSANFREVQNPGYNSSQSSTNFNNAATSIFLNDNKDLITLENLVLTGDSSLATKGSFSIKAIYATGKYKDLNLTATVLVGDQNNPNNRTLILSYIK
jgi:hypothetical protein